MEPTKSESRHVRDPELLMLVGRWRARAQELLAQAETMRDAEARQKDDRSGCEIREIGATGRATDRQDGQGVGHGRQLL